MKMVKNECINILCLLSSGQTGNSGKKNKFEKIFWGLFQDEIKKAEKV
jgi:hypothetical protein